MEGKINGNKKIKRQVKKKNTRLKPVNKIHSRVLETRTDISKRMGRKKNKKRGKKRTQKPQA